MRVEHEYERAGALALLAALDVHTGTVPAAATPATTGIAPFMALMGQVMSQQPYSSASRVLVIVDNGSGHRGQKAARRLRRAWPNAIMIHTPVHASWLNQIEIFFSIIQKKVVSPNDFTSTARLAATRLHRPLQPDRQAIQLEIHRCRPGQAPRPDQRPPGTSQPATGRMMDPRRTYGVTH
jgi:predicted phosphoribosyltransferase